MDWSYQERHEDGCMQTEELGYKRRYNGSGLKREIEILKHSIVNGWCIDNDRNTLAHKLLSQAQKI